MRTPTSSPPRPPTLANQSSNGGAISVTKMVAMVLHAGEATKAIANADAIAQWIATLERLTVEWLEKEPWLP